MLNLNILMGDECVPNTFVFHFNFKLWRIYKLNSKENVELSDVTRFGSMKNDLCECDVVWVWNKCGEWRWAYFDCKHSENWANNMKPTYSIYVEYGIKMFLFFLFVKTYLKKKNI